MAANLSRLLQATLCSATSIEGIGLHSGSKTRVHFKPAAPGHGIKFIVGGHRVDATYDNVVNTNFCTVLGSREYKVSTVEHLLAGLAACRLNNVEIEVSRVRPSESGRHGTTLEIPALDGSSKPFVDLFNSVGRREMDALLPFVEVLKPVQVRNEGNSATLLPLPEREPFAPPTLVVTVEVDFEPKLPGRRWFTCHVPDEHFSKDVAPARTFTFKEEVDKLKAAGLAQGGSLKNAVVFEKGRALNEEGLRFRDEWVRHKALDCVGDLALATAGYGIHGHFGDLDPVALYIRSVEYEFNYFAFLPGCGAAMAKVCGDCGTAEEVAKVVICEDRYAPTASLIGIVTAAETEGT